jgi:hypothetical protein
VKWYHPKNVSIMLYLDLGIIGQAQVLSFLVPFHPNNLTDHCLAVFIDGPISRVPFQEALTLERARHAKAFDRAKVRRNP